MQRSVHLVLLFFVLALVGCGDEKQTAKTDIQPATPSASLTGGAGALPPGNPNPGGAETGSTKPDRDKTVQAMKDAQTKFDASKSDEDKKALTDATFKAADAFMYAKDLSPREMYPEALRLYRKVLELDPKHEEAKQSVQTIEDIYRSMGRAIPK